MNYHVDTGFILQEFHAGQECPLCAIKNIVEQQLLLTFLEEAVMEDSARQRANEKGFCGHHYDMMFARQNKLGLALQTTTRIDYLVKEMGAFSPKNAKKQIEVLEKATKTCVICDLIEFHMTRYYKTVAQMFAREKGFREMLTSTDGFCLEHYRELLKYSSSAGLKKKEYLSVLMAHEQKHLARIRGELQWFCDKHDYRNSNKPWGTSQDALPRARTKLHGEQTK